MNKKYYFIIKYFHRRTTFSILKFIYSIYEFIVVKVITPIADRIEISAIRYRLRNLGYIDAQIYRFRRMQSYQYNKAQMSLYRKNMEVIAKISDETGIPQYILLEAHNVERSILVYKSKNDKQTKTYSILEPIYYTYQLLPSLKQTLGGIRDLLIYFRQRFQEHVWNRVEEFYFYHWIYRTLLYRIRGKSEEKAWTICYKWEYQKYLYKEKRLRREKQIRYYKSLKNRLHTFPVQYSYEQ
jgi:hypothetical protein